MHMLGIHNISFLNQWLRPSPWTNATNTIGLVEKVLRVLPILCGSNNCRFWKTLSKPPHSWFRSPVSLLNGAHPIRRRPRPLSEERFVIKTSTWTGYRLYRNNSDYIFAKSGSLSHDHLLDFFNVKSRFSSNTVAWFLQLGIEFRIAAAVANNLNVSKRNEGVFEWTASFQVNEEGSNLCSREGFVRCTTAT